MDLGEREGQVGGYWEEWREGKVWSGCNTCEKNKLKTGTKQYPQTQMKKTLNKVSSFQTVQNIEESRQSQTRAWAYTHRGMSWKYMTKEKSQVSRKKNGYSLKTKQKKKIKMSITTLRPFYLKPRDTGKMEMIKITLDSSKRCTDWSVVDTCQCT